MLKVKCFNLYLLDEQKKSLRDFQKKQGIPTLNKAIKLLIFNNLKNKVSGEVSDEKKTN